MRPLVSGVVVALACAAMAASGASASKHVLELTERGVPVAAGTEVRLELEFPACEDGKNGSEERFIEPIAFRGQMRENGSKTDTMTFGTEEGYCASNLSLYPDFARGTVKEVSMAVAGQRGKAKISASLIDGESRHAGFTACDYDIATLLGAFPIPGHARLEGHARGKLSAGSFESGSPGEKCHKTKSFTFTGAVRGPNGNLLETALK
jgi:hypothetical protein